MFYGLWILKKLSGKSIFCCPLNSLFAATRYFHKQSKSDNGSFVESWGPKGQVSIKHLSWTGKSFMQPAPVDLKGSFVLTLFRP